MSHIPPNNKTSTIIELLVHLNLNKTSLEAELIQMNSTYL